VPVCSGPQNTSFLYISCSQSFWTTLCSYLLFPVMNLSNHLPHSLPT
jgi:hypothetical protein